MKKFTRDFSYSFSLNILNLIVKSSFVLILPKIIGVSDFGYWQLYFLYTFFIAFGHLGLVDGVYLTKGGQHYQELDLKELCSQFIVLIIMGVIWASILFAYASTCVDNLNKFYILSIVALDVIVTLPRTLISVMFQMTGMIKEYSYSLMAETISCFVLIVMMILLGVKDFKILILADFIARVVSLVVSVVKAKGLIREVPYIGRETFIKSIDFISVGVFLLLSNMASLVAVATVRFSIELQWDIILFSKISLAFSIASIVVTATSAAGVVLFPLLKRIRDDSVSNSFSSLSMVLVSLTISVMILYYPATFVLKMWLPKYIESIYFLSIVLPMTFFDTQFIVIGSNYLKVLREECMLLWINSLAVGIVFIVVTVSTSFSCPVECLLYGLIIQSAVKVFTTTAILKRKFSNINTDFLIISILGAILFYFSNLIVQGVWGYFLYCCGVAGLIFIYRQELLKSINFLRLG